MLAEAPSTGRVTARPAPSFDDLSMLPRRRLSALRRARRDLFATIRAFRRAGGHPVRDVLGGGPRPFTWFTHYPDDDVDDVPRGYAWYYHAHEPSESRPWEEHGHFHCYCYPKLLPETAIPIAIPVEGDAARAAGIVHLLGLSLNATGAPMRLFTINRWASNEWMYAADDLLPLIDRFMLAEDTPFPLVSRWLSAMLRVLEPQIAWLMRERDRVLAEHRLADPTGFSEDRSLDVVSTLTFDLDSIYAALDRAE